MTSIAIHTPARRDPVISNGSSSWRMAFLRHAYIIPSFAIVLLVCAWFMTWGDWRFFDREVFCGFYDAQARSILHGRLDVPPRAIGIEAFYFRGNTYGYFGIGPALLRIPLVLISKGMDGRWSRGLMFIACFINLLCAYRILLWARGAERVQTAIDRILNSLFILCAGIGSTNIFIVDRCYTYHEAIMMGATFALLFTVAIIYYFRSQNIRALAAAGAFAFFSFHSRPTGGAGALLVLGILAAIFMLRAMTGKAIGQKFLSLPVVDRPFRHALVAGIACLIIVSVYFGVNYGKFRTFDGVPVKYYGMYHTDPRRMVVTGGKQIHIENIPTGLASYFGMRGATFHASFPWIYMSRTPSVLGHPAIDVVEQYSSVPISMPALGLLALLGAMFALRGPRESIRHMRLPITGLMIGGGIILMTVGITERYVHDLYPFLIVAAAAGVARVAEGKNPRRVTGLIAVLAVISIALNCTFALEYQRLAVWGVSPAKRVEMQNVQHAVDQFFHVQPAPVADDEQDTMNRYFVTGGAGFIGSNLVDRLLEDGHCVTAYDNFSSGQRGFIEQAAANPRFRLYEGDILDLPRLMLAMREHDMVFHLAANADVRFGTNHPRRDLEQNTIGTHNVLEAMRSAGVTRIAFSSTGSVYGEPDVFPTPETAPFPVQTSLYAASKLAGEAMISAYCAGFGFQAAIFRFVSILGERYSHGHVFDFYQQLSRDGSQIRVFGDGGQRKSYLYVQDCIDAMQLAIDRMPGPVNIYNLGCAEYCRVNDSLDWICAKLNVDPKRNYTGGSRGWIGDSPFIFLDTQRIAALGWKPKLSIRQGVEKTVEYLASNRWLFEARKAA